MRPFNDEPYATVSAHVPVSLRRLLLEGAREADRSFSGEVRRALAYYAAREYDNPETREIDVRVTA